MNIEEVVAYKDSAWVSWENETFILKKKIPRGKRQNRETLAYLYRACMQALMRRGGLTYAQASRIVRSLWIEETPPKRPKSLPRIIGEDGFLRMYALGLPCPLTLFKRIWERTAEAPETKTIKLEPLIIAWNTEEFFDVDATPPGCLPKFVRYYRLKKDKALLQRIASDLKKVSQFEEAPKRIFLTLAILSHAVVYRELNGVHLLLPSFSRAGKLILYTCEQHLIEAGLKTVSLVPQSSDEDPIYLCQGTEFWPSQPSMLGSIIANFGEHGSATAAYAHSWRRIHLHLRKLGHPYVAGHSMGGALAIQIGLYSHSLIKQVYAFNPPVPNERDYAFYHQMSEDSKNKIRVIANLDDFAFWRIGSKVIGRVTVFLGIRRWKYYSVSLLDCMLLFPAFVKFVRNVHHAFPAHQRIAALEHNWVSVDLTQEEVEKENAERIVRFDYLHFLPKLYDPMKVLLTHIRKIFKWRLQEVYLGNEIEILALHERDLLDTLTEENREETERQLHLLHAQKEALLKRLLRIKNQKTRNLK
jgi:pimeloyl-ACP methyl ester carboxylesterase